MGAFVQKATTPYKIKSCMEIAPNEHILKHILVDIFHFFTVNME